MPIFTIRITTRGGLQSSFVFTDEQERDEWLTNTFPRLEAEYGKLQLTEISLDGLQVGDKCRVIGDGDDVFIIESLEKYSDHRFGFCLDSGLCEDVAKCYRA